MAAVADPLPQSLPCTTEALAAIACSFDRSHASPHLDLHRNPILPDQPARSIKVCIQIVSGTPCGRQLSSSTQTDACDLCVLSHLADGFAGIDIGDQKATDSRLQSVISDDYAKEIIIGLGNENIDPSVITKLTSDASLNDWSTRLLELLPGERDDMFSAGEIPLLYGLIEILRVGTAKRLGSWSFDKLLSLRKECQDCTAHDDTIDSFGDYTRRFGRVLCDPGVLNFLIQESPISTVTADDRRDLATALIDFEQLAESFSPTEGGTTTWGSLVVDFIKSVPVIYRVPITAAFADMRARGFISEGGTISFAVTARDYIALLVSGDRYYFPLLPSFTDEWRQSVTLVSAESKVAAGSPVAPSPASVLGSAESPTNTGGNRNNDAVTFAGMDIGDQFKIRHAVATHLYSIRATEGQFDPSHDSVIPFVIERFGLPRPEAEMALGWCLSIGDIEEYCTAFVEPAIHVKELRAQRDALRITSAANLTAATSAKNTVAQLQRAVNAHKAIEKQRRIQRRTEAQDSQAAFDARIRSAGGRAAASAVAAQTLAVQHRDLGRRSAQLLADEKTRAAAELADAHARAESTKRALLERIAALEATATGPPSPTCEAPDCDRKATAFGYCSNVCREFARRLNDLKTTTAPAAGAVRPTHASRPLVNGGYGSGIGGNYMQGGARSPANDAASCGQMDCGHVPCETARGFRPLAVQIAAELGVSSSQALRTMNLLAASQSIQAPATVTAPPSRALVPTAAPPLRTLGRSLHTPMDDVPTRDNRATMLVMLVEKDAEIVDHSYRIPESFIMSLVRKHTEDLDSPDVKFELVVKPDGSTTTKRKKKHKYSVVEVASKLTFDHVRSQIIGYIHRMLSSQSAISPEQRMAYETRLRLWTALFSEVNGMYVQAMATSAGTVRSTKVTQAFRYFGLHMQLLVHYCVFIDMNRRHAHLYELAAAHAPATPAKKCYQDPFKVEGGNAVRAFASATPKTKNKSSVESKTATRSRRKPSGGKTASKPKVPDTINASHPRIVDWLKGKCFACGDGSHVRGDPACPVTAGGANATAATTAFAKKKDGMVAARKKAVDAFYKSIGY